MKSKYYSFRLKEINYVIGSIWDKCLISIVCMCSMDVDDCGCCSLYVGRALRRRVVRLEVLSRFVRIGFDGV